MYLKRLQPFIYLGAFYILISFILRFIFIFHPLTTSRFSILEGTQMSLIGFINDALIFVLLSSLFVLYLTFISNTKYYHPWGGIILAILIFTTLYCIFYPIRIFREHGNLYAIIIILLSIKTLIFALLLYSNTSRFIVRNTIYFFIIFFYIFFILLNAVGEFLFWNEFGTRYNFIALDYIQNFKLLIGNILESYPISILLSVIIPISLCLTWIIYDKTKDNLIQLPTFQQKLKLIFPYIISAVLIGLFLISFMGQSKHPNNFYREIEANGLYKLYQTFIHNNNTNDFNSPTLASSQTYQFVSQAPPPNPPKIIKGEAEEQHKNVVLISVKSISASFLAHYGNTQNLTPFLDSLAQKSLLFTNMYATGIRSVYGLEALTLNIPPTVEESIVKRKNSSNKNTSGGVFKSKGYLIKYLYGGYNGFDNMQDFFRKNGYDVVGPESFRPHEISFANTWGISDEDMARKAIQIMNGEADSGKPFFNHWMTASNHRPFTYPDGKIEIPSTAKSREGGVKYTDYSLRKFFEMAKRQKWYNNTVFVIVADHCSYTTGKSELSVEGYRIPAMIYSPDGSIPAQHFNTLMSQIDLMPTLWGLLNFSHPDVFLGRDVMKPNYIPRAYIASQQDLGYIKDNYLTIISADTSIKQYQLQQKYSNLPAEFNIYYYPAPIKQPIRNLVNEAMTNYKRVYP
ncbi:sulfatase-like hydrolase/transferase [Elizabethkingia argentiflava]|uniref:Sulfatase-like hydrolase/transferase n=2 Tax=Elizabethkingia argenteiflava TaxID=2681556 RepID=A0A845PTT9_9FLAO|nr:sulfatase-like hydrolase/transferase [Elizabethkingia argenteiflava]